MKDYIDRAELMKFPIRRDRCDKENANPNFICGIETVLEYADNLPCEDVRPVRHGWWDDDGCSVCKHTIAIKLNGREIYLHDILQPPFCPYCGAQMLSIVPEVE